MKYFVSSMLLVLVLLSNQAQVPSGYYDSAENLSAYELKTALHNIIDDHSAQGYGDLWTFIKNNTIDTYYENDGTILDIYSENPTGDDPYNFTITTDQCGNYSSEGDCYNREHSFPQSWFSKASPMVTDVHHIFATDGKVNSMRSSYPYGNVGSASSTSDNGSKLGSGASDLGYTGIVFEPIDEFKGDLARAQFYMATRYEDIIDGWESNASEILDGSNQQVYKEWFVDLLLEWHELDPVSQKELDRNDAAYPYQGNRNPFVDNPDYVNCIWGNTCNDTSIVVDTVTTKDICGSYIFPISTDNPTWYEVEFTDSDTSDFSSHNYIIYRLINDTVLNKENYSKLVSLTSPTAYIGTSEYIGSMRTDDCGVTYFIPKGQTSEHVLYDFSKETGDTVFSEYLNEFGINQFKVLGTDSLDLGNLGYRKTMEVSDGENTSLWIEGIGSNKGLLWPTLPTDYCPSDSSFDCPYGRLLLCNYQYNEFAFKGWDGDCYYEKITSYVKDISAKNLITIYPKPANDKLYIKTSDTNGILEIYNQMGKQVKQMDLEGSELIIHVEYWPSGMYFVILKNISGSTIQAQRILIN